MIEYRIMRIGGDYQRQWVKWGEFLVVLLLVFFVDLGGWFGWGRMGLERLVYPFAVTSSYLGRQINEAGKRLEFSAEGARRIVELEQELASKEGLVVELRRLREENESLRQQAGVLPGGRKYVMGKVVSKMEKRLFLSVKEKGVEVGQGVYWRRGYVGKVESVGKRLVRVVKLEGMEEKLAVEVLGDDGGLIDEGVLQKDARYGLILRKLSKDYGELLGGVVVAKGDKGFVREGVVLGRVKEKVEEKGEVLSQVVVEAYYELEIGDYLYIEVGEIDE